MLDKPPPSRYRVIERDRRLITIDTWSGAEVGSQTGAGSAPMASQSPLELSVKAPAAPQPAAKSPGPWPRGMEGSPVEKQGRAMMLAVGAIAFALFLFFTSLWIPALILMAIPQSRDPIVSAVKSGVTRYLNGA
jgi:hypothetical protein